MDAVCEREICTRFGYQWHSAAAPQIAMAFPVSATTVGSHGIHDSVRGTRARAIRGGDDRPNMCMDKRKQVQHTHTPGTVRTHTDMDKHMDADKPDARKRVRR
jgi:chloramphenicol 3-O-phosphotransferase